MAEYSDAETSLARAVWGTVLYQRASVVLETGVARGVTSRIRSFPRVDLFIHDSLHTARNTRFEMEHTLSAMRLMVVDDIGTQQAFAEFAPDFPSLLTPGSTRALL